MTHFTYADTLDKTCLKQGDVLKKTPELANIINDIHPYFQSEKYKYFLVLTQTCDLVRRKDERCKTKYITIAAIRSLEDALKRQAEEIAKSKLERKTKKLIDEKSNAKISEFLTGLFNNNSTDYFYLHHDVSLDFVDPSVAFLRVSISLKSEFHYNLCLSSKVLELDENFQAKLGWLVGNLYSRVGTEDWVPGTLDQQRFRKMVSDQVKTHFNIVSNLSEIENILEGKYSEEQLEALSVDDLIEIVKKEKVSTRKDKVLSKLEEIILNSNALKEDYDIKKLMTRISNDASITSFLK
jgi:hypothetical protein